MLLSSMQIEVFRDFKRAPWRKGLGFTEELLIEPRAANFSQDLFRYRISSAAVSGKTEFSKFSGYQRLLVLLNGTLKLSHQNGTTSLISQLDLEAFVPHFFSGNDLTLAEVVGKESIRDFGIIFYPDLNLKCKILFERIDLKLDEEKKYFIFCSGTPARILSSDLKPNELALLTSRKSEIIPICPSSPLILIELDEYKKSATESK